MHAWVVALLVCDRTQRPSDPPWQRIYRSQPDAVRLGLWTSRPNKSHIPPLSFSLILLLFRRPPPSVAPAARPALPAPPLPPAPLLCAPAPLLLPLLLLLLRAPVSLLLPLLRRPRALLLLHHPFGSRTPTGTASARSSVKP
jgi:hypothetical protein